MNHDFRGIVLGCALGLGAAMSAFAGLAADQSANSSPVQTAAASAADARAPSAVQAAPASATEKRAPSAVQPAPASAAETSAPSAPTAPDPALRVRAIAEVEARVNQGGRAVVKLIPADRVVPGDRVIYTLEVTNISATAVEAPVVSHAVPEHMRYLGDSAVGPGAEVRYSVDGGLSFDRAENLTVSGPDGKPRRAVAADYTHIRWQLKNSLQANSVAFVRFRAQVE